MNLFQNTKKHLFVPTNSGICCSIKKANALFMDSRTHLNTHRYEVEADTFAMDLLIDDDLIAEYEPYTADQISHLLGYRKDLVKLRFQQK